MASSTNVYEISIANSNSNTSPKDGFVDNKRIEDYGVDLTNPNLTLAQSQAKRRGNWRYRFIIEQLGLLGNAYVIPGTITPTGGSITTEPSNFAFQIIAERGGSAFVTADETTTGVTLTDVAAIKRCVARALIADCFKQTDVFDPTAGTTTGSWGSTTSVPRYGSRIDVASDFEIGAYATSITTAEALITVTQKL